MLLAIADKQMRSPPTVSFGRADGSWPDAYSVVPMNKLRMHREFENQKHWSDFRATPKILGT
jgi:hypothetical protein